MIEMRGRRTCMSQLVLFTSFLLLFSIVLTIHLSFNAVLGIHTTKSYSTLTLIRSLVINYALFLNVLSMYDPILLHCKNVTTVLLVGVSKKLTQLQEGGEGGPPLSFVLLSLYSS